MLGYFMPYYAKVRTQFHDKICLIYRLYLVVLDYT